jgi:hypothetical protein
MGDSDQYVQDIIELHKLVHQQLREEITGLDSETLNWTPGPETNSIGTIVTHALGAGAEMLRNILDIPTNRVRDAEFASQTHRRDNLLHFIDAAEDDWQSLAPRVGEEELRTFRPRPNKPVPQSGLYWLVRNYGHMREHLAQVQLTKQLYQMRDH